MTVAVKIENLSKKYIIGHQKQERYTALRDVMMHKLRGIGQRLRHPLSANREEVDLEEFWALKDINLEIKQGDRVGIIGRNGAGKSTLLKVLSRITEPTSGRIQINGRVASLLEVGTGFHPELSGRENIFLNGAILGMGRVEIKRKFDEIVDFSGVEKFLDTPVKRYSSGMYVRLAFAVAAHLEPEILIVDEVLAVGDAEFQKKCLGKMEDAGKDGKTVLFVSHNMGAVQQLTKKAILLGSGELVMAGSTPVVVESYLVKSIDPEINHSLRTDDKDFKIDTIKFNYGFLENGFNKPLRFDLKLSVQKNKKQVLFGFAIVNSIGAKILTSECMVPLLETGSVDIALVLREHHLPPGNYVVNLGISIAGVLVLYQENVLGFDLSDLNIDNPVLTRKRDKMGAYLPCEWSISK